MAFVEVTDPVKIDALAEAQLLWYKGTEWAEEDYIPFQSGGSHDLPSCYDHSSFTSWQYFILVEA